MPKVSASAMAAICTPARSWLTAFIAEAGACAVASSKTVSAMASSAGRAVVKASGVPEAMTVSCPVAALPAPPEMGASR